MSIGISIFVTFILIVLNGFFSASEMALVNARRTKLQAAADEGNKKAERALEVSGDSDRLLATIQVFITLLGFFASAVSATTLSAPLSVWMEGTFGLSAEIGRPLATVLITLVVSYVSIVIGELLPKRIALANAEGMAQRLAGPIAACETIAHPLVALTAASSNALATLFGVKSADDRQEVSEEEIKYMVAGNDELLPDEKRMIHEIMELGDTVAREIMTPRADMILVEDIETIKQAVERMRGTGNTRLPVYHEDYDRIVGLVNFKDLVPAIMDHRDDDLVGEIIDETDQESKYVTQLSEDEWIVDGSLPVEDAIELGWPLEESEEYETIAGWLIDAVDELPQLADEYVIDRYRYTITSMRRHRVQKIRVKYLGEEEDLGVIQGQRSEHDG